MLGRESPTRSVKVFTLQGGRCPWCWRPMSEDLAACKPSSSSPSAAAAWIRSGISSSCTPPAALRGRPQGLLRRPDTRPREGPDAPPPLHRSSPLPAGVILFMAAARVCGAASLAAILAWLLRVTPAAAPHYDQGKPWPGLRQPRGLTPEGSPQSRRSSESARTGAAISGWSICCGSIVAGQRLAARASGLRRRHARPRRRPILPRFRGGSARPWTRVGGGGCARLRAPHLLWLWVRSAWCRGAAAWR